MPANAFVALGLIGAALLVGCWDVYASVKLGPGSTVTAVIREWSSGYPILPFLAGLLAGHLFGW